MSFCSLMANNASFPTNLLLTIKLLQHSFFCRINSHFSNQKYSHSPNKKRASNSSIATTTQDLRELGLGFPSPRMEVGTGATSRRSRFSSYDRLVAVGLGLLAVVSPLYIDRRPSVEAEEYEESFINFGFWLPFLLITLIFTIAGVLHLQQRCARFDAYWIHRVGGSSCGIFIILLLLAFVLKCKASLMFWES